MLKLTKTSQDFDGIESFYEFNGQKALKFGHCEKKKTCVCSAYILFFRVKNGNPRAETVVCHQEMWATTMISHEVLISISKCIYLYAIQELCE